jgi:hypothetical protein
MWQFWASEMLQKRLSNASVTVQNRSTDALHILLDVFVDHGLRYYVPGPRAVNLGVFLQLNLPHTAGESNTVISRTLSTKVSCWSIQPD